MEFFAITDIIIITQLLISIRILILLLVILFKLIQDLISRIYIIIIWIILKGAQIYRNFIIRFSNLLPKILISIIIVSFFNFLPQYIFTLQFIFLLSIKFLLILKILIDLFRSFFIFKNKWSISFDF